MWRTPVLGVAMLISAPAVYAAARGQSDLSFPVLLAVIAGGASLGLAVDDPAESTLTPCPVPRASRRAMRAAMIAATIATSWAIVAICTQIADHPIGRLQPRLAEAAAAATISFAFASRAALAGSDSPGIAAITGTIAAFGISSGLALYLTWLPQIGQPAHTSRWWAVAAIGATAAWWWSRDPSSRGPIAWPTRG